MCEKLKTHPSVGAPGDIDMAAMLLNAKADPDTKALANLPSARCVVTRSAHLDAFLRLRVLVAHPAAATSPPPYAHTTRSKMAEDMAKDSKCKYQSEAKQIVAIINDPILMAQRLALLHERLEKTKALDKKRAMNLCARADARTARTRLWTFAIVVSPPCEARGRSHQRALRALECVPARVAVLVVIVMAIFYGIFYFFLGKTGAGQRFLQRDHEL